MAAFVCSKLPGKVGVKGEQLADQTNPALPLARPETADIPKRNEKARRSGFRHGGEIDAGPEIVEGAPVAARSLHAAALISGENPQKAATNAIPPAIRPPAL